MDLDFRLLHLICNHININHVVLNELIHFSDERNKLLHSIKNIEKYLKAKKKADLSPLISYASSAVSASAAIEA